MSTVDAKIIEHIANGSNSGGNNESTLKLLENVKPIMQFSSTYSSDDYILFRYSNSTENFKYDLSVGDILYLHNKITNEDEMFICVGPGVHPEYPGAYHRFVFVNTVSDNRIYVDYHIGNSEYMIFDVIDTYEFSSDKLSMYRVNIDNCVNLETAILFSAFRAIEVEQKE